MQIEADHMDHERTTVSPSKKTEISNDSGFLSGRDERI